MHLRGDDHDHAAALARPPRAELADIWDELDLPVPATTLDLLGTMIGMVNDLLPPDPGRLVLAHGSLPGGGYEQVTPRILPALMEQLRDWVAAGLPARVCANETCDRLFTRQRGRAEHAQHRASGTKYCSASCAAAQSSREYRRRKAAGAGQGG